MRPRWTMTMMLSCPAGSLALMLALAACFDSHEHEQQPGLRPASGQLPDAAGSRAIGEDSGRAMTGSPSTPRAGAGTDADASADTRDGSAAAGASSPGSADASASNAGSSAGGELQVWLGAARSLSAGVLICGADIDPRAEQRALLLLELDTEGKLLAASLTLGKGAPLPPPTDPNAYYPPDPPWTWHGCPVQGLVPGFEYTAEQARLEPARLSASIFPAEVIKPWCELQPSYRAAPAAAEEWGEYLCRPTDQVTSETDLSSASPPHGPDDPFVAGELCLTINAPCACDANACTSSRYRGMNLDLSIHGTTMTGRLAHVDIKLERQR
jgi:hypothetical protein